MKVEEGVILALEARRRAEEEEEHPWIEAEEAAHLIGDRNRMRSTHGWSMNKSHISLKKLG